MILKLIFIRTPHFYKRYKKWFVSLAALIFITLVLLYTVPMFLTPSIVVGVYDPSGDYNSEKKITIQNFYFSWDENVQNIVAPLSRAKSLQRIPLVTIEPWNSEHTQQSVESLLGDIIKGKYDDSMHNTCKALSSLDEPLIIRWGHEMDLSGSRYSWAGKNPYQFIQSYKRFVNVCKTYSSKFKYMWSPSGEEGLVNYWPGAEHVDIIGLSIYSFDQWDMKYLQHQRSFNEIFAPKYDRVKNFNKPIFVAEMGVTGDMNYQKKWISDLANDIKQYPLLRGFVYFNAQDLPGAWGQDLGIADFRITGDSLLPLIQTGHTKYSKDSHFYL